MTSASSSSARSLFAESKQRLAERVQVNMNNISSLARQIQRGSKSNEKYITFSNVSFHAMEKWAGDILNLHRKGDVNELWAKCIVFLQLLNKAAREISFTENQMESSEENLKKMQLISVHIGYQYENIHKSAQMLSEINEQIISMQR